MSARSRLPLPARACIAHATNPGVCVLRRDGPCDAETDQSLLNRPIPAGED